MMAYGASNQFESGEGLHRLQSRAAVSSNPERLFHHDVALASASQCPTQDHTCMSHSGRHTPQTFCLITPTNGMPPNMLRCWQRIVHATLWRHWWIMSQTGVIDMFPGFDRVYKCQKGVYRICQVLHSTRPGMLMPGHAVAREQIYTV